MHGLSARRRGVAVAALVALMLAWLVVSPGTASASTGGTARAAGLEGELLAVEVLGIPVVPGITIAEAIAGTPASNAAGNGSDSASAVSVDLGPGLLGAVAVAADTVRTTDGLRAHAEVAGVSINLFGVSVLGAAVISSRALCPIAELSGVPTSADVTDMIGLEVGGAPAAVGTPIDPIDVTVAGVVGAQLVVSITSPTATSANDASATGLQVDINLIGSILGVPIDVDVLDLALAHSECTRPAGSTPTTTSLVPSSGPELTTVTVNGTGFIPGSTTVTFGGVTIPAVDVTVDDTLATYGTSLTFEVPDDSPLGATPVAVTTPVGTSTPALDFTVTAAQPVATSLTPTSGPELTVVTVNGDNFVPNATTVGFGGTTILAGDVTVAPDGNSLIFVVPDDSPLGATPVTVTTAGGTTTPALTFTVTLAAPTAASLVPDAGPEATVVTLNGDDFVVGATSVTFGSVVIPAGSVTVASDGNSLTFVVPDDSPLGATAVTATTTAGTTNPLTFTVTPAVPTATGLSPTSGPELTVVTVNGDNFVPGATSIQFGSLTVPAGSVTVALDGNSLTFAIPDDAPLGATGVVAVTAGGSSTPALSFTVTAAPPSIGGITPTEGPTGTTVIITGDNFIPGETSVIIGGVEVSPADVTVSGNGDSLTFVVPDGLVVGAQQVRVVTGGGISAPVTFTVTAAPIPVPVTGTGTLPFTGSGWTGPTGLMGLLLLLLGAALAFGGTAGRPSPRGTRAFALVPGAARNRRASQSVGMSDGQLGLGGSGSGSAPDLGAAGRPSRLS